MFSSSFLVVPAMLLSAAPTASRDALVIHPSVATKPALSQRAEAAECSSWCKLAMPGRQLQQEIISERFLLNNRVKYLKEKLLTFLLFPFKVKCVC